MGSGTINIPQTQAERRQHARGSVDPQQWVEGCQPGDPVIPNNEQSAVNMLGDPLIPNNGWRAINCETQ